MLEVRLRLDMHVNRQGLFLSVVSSILFEISDMYLLRYVLCYVSLVVYVDLS